MRARDTTWFVSCAVANGLASGLALAAALEGHWIATVTLLAASIVCAGGMIRNMGALRSAR